MPYPLNKDWGGNAIYGLQLYIGMCRCEGYGFNFFFFRLENCVSDLSSFWKTATLG